MFIEFTQSIDLAQVTLYAFWLFFAGLIYWLRMEDRREGYPLESDTPVRVGAEDNFLFPKAKLFYKPEGGTYSAPNFERDTRPIEATRASASKGSPLIPNGDPLLSGVGPASHAARHDEPEMTREGHHAIVPLRVATDYSISAGPDPRGFALVLADGKSAGTIVDLWVDRAEMQIRYLEVALSAGESKAAESKEAQSEEARSEEPQANEAKSDEAKSDEAKSGEAKSGEAKSGEASTVKPAAGRRLIPLNVVLVDGEARAARSSAIYSHQLESVPTTQHDHSITLLEEERIQAFYAGGYLYADARRAEPLV